LLGLTLLGSCLLAAPTRGSAQVSYVARFTMEKRAFLAGEPIFCTFSIQNTGSTAFSFSYRTPSRLLNPELESEPRFKVRDSAGRPVGDPAPRPCGGEKGSAVYGSVRLPPGQTHTERWVLNQWARFSRPGRYSVRAERRLPLFAFDPAREEFSDRPAAFSLAINELSLELTEATAADLKSRFDPYLKILDQPSSPSFPEAALAVTTLPQPFMLDRLVKLAHSSAEDRRFDRMQALEGLARLGTAPAWDAILKIALGEGGTASTPAGVSKGEPLRAYAVLLLGERGESSFLPPLLKLLSRTPQDLRGEILRALGLFHDPRANQVLFENLRSPDPNDRVSAILGLRNLEDKDSIPALIAMLKDSDGQVRQVANFALQRLTGKTIRLASSATAAESGRVAQQWHSWWRENGGQFVLVHQPPCQDW
jgi:HEAT repeat protein